MDLSPFCARANDRPNLSQPFTKGEWTYATNGHIAVRVPRRESVPERPDTPNAEKLFTDTARGEYVPLPPVEIPEVSEQDECEHCDGRGTQHTCPNCDCECVECHGKGHPIRGHKISVGIGPCSFWAKYVLMLQALSSVELTLPDKPEIPARFRFDGGEGLLMQMRGTSPDHIVADLSPAASAAHG